MENTADAVSADSYQYTHQKTTKNMGHLFLNANPSMKSLIVLVLESEVIAH